MTKQVIAAAMLMLANSGTNADELAPNADVKNYKLNIDGPAALAWHPLAAPLSRGLIVSILINGKNVKAATDTGDTVRSTLTISSTAASRLGIKRVDGHQEAVTYGGKRTSELGLADKIDIGGISFSNAQVSISTDLGFDADVDAVMGTQVLQYMTLVVDSDNSRVRFLFPGELSGLQNGPGMIQMTQKTVTSWPSISIAFCNNSARLVVDTGDNGEIQIKDSIFRKVTCASSVESDVRANTAGGPVISRRIGVANASVQGIPLGPVLAKGIPTSGAQTLDIDGSVGLGVLGRFNFALDTSSRRLLLLGYSNLQTSSRRPTIGLQFEELPGAIKVVHIERNSPASKSPLRVGDTICFVGGKSISELGDRFETNPAAGHILTLKTCQGRSVSITAADFFFPSAPSATAAFDLHSQDVGDFTSAVVDCLYGKSGTKTASCTKVIEAPQETRAVGDFRIVAFLYRAKGKIALGDTAGAREDFRRVLQLDPANGYALAALRESHL